MAPHHLVDILSITERYDTNRFLTRARPLLQRLQQQGRPAVVVGGTGLYAKALLYGFELEPSDHSLAATLAQQAQTDQGLDELEREVAALDPERAAALRTNPRHLVRAVEVLRLSGRLPQRQEPAQGQDCRPVPGSRQFVVLPPQDEFRHRIVDRVHEMLAQGWIEETRELVRKGLMETPTARQALGYRDIAAWLDAGTPGGEGALVETLIARNLQYARRQRTWFRRQHPGAILLPLQHRITAETLMRAMLSDVQRACG
jgi:tRNA dimethylallyltransferase